MPKLNSFAVSLLAVAGLSALATTSHAASIDHAIFPQLQGPFATGPDVTKACLTCHSEAARQVQKTIHWTWDYTSPSGQKLGKRNVINNFCVSLQSNEPRCTSCHVGYGWRDNTFDFAAETNVDCLVCHDQTGTYKKFPTDAGHPNYTPKNSRPARCGRSPTSPRRRRA
jgi:hypothetical protein